MEWVDPADQTVTTMALEQHEASGCQLQRSLRVRHKILQVQHRLSEVLKHEHKYLKHLGNKKKFTSSPSQKMSSCHISLTALRAFDINKSEGNYTT